jgi:TRAP-type C4-dicarboxylate transport system substrate-binding protein
MTSRTARPGARRRSALAVLLVIVSACGNAGLNRGVGDQPQRITLTFATIFHDPGIELQSFADAVASRSEDTVRIEFRGDAHADEVKYETAIVNDVKDGKVDLGWVAPRPWHGMGITTFDALAAPLLVDSYALQQAVLDSPVAVAMLDGLDGSGLVGLGILPGPLRIVGAADRPFLRPVDFDGATVAIQDSAIAVSTFEALGATTMAIGGGGRVEGADALEQQAGSFVGNNYERVMNHISINMSLWPRPLILFANKGRYDALTGEQQEAIRLAARDAAPSAMGALLREDEVAIATLCERGADIVTASAADLSMLRDAVQPVYDQLDQDPATAQHIAAIAAMKVQLGLSDAPRTCPSAAASPSAGLPEGVGFPDGTYETEITAEEVKDRPQDAGCPCTWGFILEHGAFRLSDPAEQPVDVEFFGDHMTLPHWNGPDRSITVRWVYDAQTQQVTFSELVGGTEDDRFVFERTWVRSD